MPPGFKESTQLSDKEKTILAVGWKCLEAEPKVDWKKLGDLGGYTNYHSAQNCFTAAKKKLMEITDDGGDDAQGASAPTTPSKGKKRVSTPAKGRKKRVAEDEDAGADGDGDEVPTPTPKKAKKAAAKAGVQNDKSGQEMEDDDGVV